MDMRGNTSQLFNLYQKDVKNWEYIEDMILTAPELYSRSWLLWLKRALELIERFFYYVMTDPNIVAQKTDSLQPMLVRAYNEVLKVSYY
jgi:predicted RNA methylase